MANKELANQWKHGCMHGMYAWNDLGTPTLDRPEDMQPHFVNLVNTITPDNRRP